MKSWSLVFRNNNITSIKKVRYQKYRTFFWSSSLSLSSSGLRRSVHRSSHSSAVHTHRSNTTFYCAKPPHQTFPFSYPTYIYLSSFLSKSFCFAKTYYLIYSTSYPFAMTLHNFVISSEWFAIAGNPISTSLEGFSIVENPYRVIEKPCHAIEKPYRIIEKSYGVTEKLCHVVENPYRMTENPCRVIENI
mgnify:CR=1 FL=1